MISDGPVSGMEDFKEVTEKKNIVVMKLSLFQMPLRVIVFLHISIGFNIHRVFISRIAIGHVGFSWHIKFL